MSLLLGSLTIGIIVSLLALGVYISFRIFKFPDMSCEGSFTLGAAVATVLVVAGSGPLTATLAAVLVGGAAGALTGVIH
jgi:putative ABC transport system permease protein